MGKSTSITSATMALTSVKRTIKMTSGELQLMLAKNLEISN
jgi:hypothetical protein